MSYVYKAWDASYYASQHASASGRLLSYAGFLETYYARPLALLLSTSL
ncbi:hypothetical protein G6011_09743, partial [Alternaria panax]